MQSRKNSSFQSREVLVGVGYVIRNYMYWIHSTLMRGWSR